MKVYDYIYHTPTLEATYEGESLGIFSVEVIDETCVEVHAYILPQHRKHSMRLLKAFRDFIYNTTNFTTIQTTVTGDFFPIVRALCFIGFKVMDVEDGVVKKGGKVYDLYHLQHNKGE